MRAVILMDNLSNNPDLTPEWGLAIYIEFEGKKYLLDTGAGPLFAENAEKLGIDLADVDFGILSHAHYDHADGMDTFFEKNTKADFWLRHPAKENCYGSKEMETIDY
ncbi:MAG: MBL fold metallo-hydrolase, partial [Ruminiclostridium sp.]|nr:MBL fold metallo-hydrolase [Ruminiclostridium sp.]